MEKYLIKIDRFSAWVLLLTIIAYAISGYGMTKEILNPDFARKMHLDYLAIVTLVVFVIHTSYAIRMALKRWQIWNNFSKAILFTVYLLVIIFFVYIGIFYNQPSPSMTTINLEDQEVVAPAVTKPSVATATTPSTPAVKIFTLSELLTFNGQNGQPAYVAVDGLVYDLSSVFKKGYHAGYPAGKDLSTKFHDKHSNSYLSGYPVVGRLQ